ncbi:alpha/beta fold hydrolase [Glaciimonas sp. CA11.2]|uniref:alpha/beta hydrolase n=1 Tax=Glaciimonas sp. CA11.2 TaxID=3048601 RepID=UPI002AB4ECD9|nr:alpha/beta fold hydrolase [Glaciimonas sp. CA11.2]MDY7545473.1 alpha/beta fold hydrolase [Glaciimonas sp. CA11.2]MEB0162698.1 alpha/beta fold hydrolase [Glaciimonas sp. CA11.2]
MKIFVKIVKVLMGLLMMASAGMSAAADGEKIVMQEFMVPSADPGIQLYVRNKHLQSIKKFGQNKILLYVHGSTYPSETAFDLPLNGMSWMDYIAQHGYDVYLVDLRGYGRSTRPPEMSQAADQNAPLVRTETAVKDVGAAVDFILKRTGSPKLDLLGWSWGTSTMGWYTSQNNDKVNKLVLYAPQWLRNDASLTDTGGKLGAYRSVSMDSAKKRWLTGVPENKKESLIPAGWYEQWAQATLATDTVGASQSKPVLRAPNGTVQDSREFWSVGKPLYDPGLIRVPTFLAHAEWDADLPSYMLHAYFAKLTNVPYKRYVEIGEGTHTIIMEKNRMQLFQAVQGFLDEDIKPDL